jgi:hypothetical protein
LTITVSTKLNSRNLIDWAMNPKTGISNQIMFGSDSPILFGVFPKAVIWDSFDSGALFVEFVLKLINVARG